MEDEKTTKRSGNEPLKELDAPEVVEPQFDAANYKELSSLESGDTQTESEVVSPESTPTTPIHTYVQPEKKRRTGIIVTSCALIMLLVLSGGGVTYWYAMIRTPDVEYEKTVATLNAMMDSAKSIESFRESVKSKKNEATYTNASSVRLTATLDNESLQKIKELKVAKEKATEFLENDRVLSATKLMEKDLSIKAVYDSSKKVISEYARTADEYYRTGHKFVTVYSYCNAGLVKIQEYGTKLTLETFNSEMKFCSDQLVSTRSLASEKFNKAFYNQYREASLVYLDSIRDMYNSKSAGQLDAALQKILRSQNDLAKIDTSKLEEILPSQQPLDQLKRLKEKVEERRNVFFR